MSQYQVSEHYLLWPYFGSEDIGRDAHDALERAAELFTPGGGALPGSGAGRRPRGRPRRPIPPSPES
jgi:hypothetical protein